jgi:predicted metalloprotease
VNASKIMVCLAVSAALALSACGDDDDDKKDSGQSTTTTATQQEQQGTAEGATLTDVEPRSAKPNLAGGDAPIDEFINKYVQDAQAYWTQVFQNSNAQYRPPNVTVATQATPTDCDKEFDPSAGPGVFYCAAEQGADLFYGPAFLDGLRGEAGDGGVAFLVGYGVALDANNQVAGNPVGTGKEVGGDFVNLAGCFTGAWIRNLHDREILEDGDDAEILELAGQFLGEDATVGKKAVILGHDEGVGACQQQYSA